MAISYMQCRHGFPTLQDDSLLEAAGRARTDVWVGWGREKGVPAHVSFVDTIDENELQKLPIPTIKFKGHRIIHLDVSFQDLVKGFFDFYNDFLQDSGKSSDPDIPHHTTHCLSIWKGCAVKRGFKYDPGADVKAERTGKVEQKRSQPVLGFAQPHSWCAEHLVTQDPFLFDKNCSGALTKRVFDRISYELKRALDIVSSPDADLEELLERADKERKRRRRRERGDRRRGDKGNGDGEEGKKRGENGSQSGQQSTNNQAPIATMATVAGLTAVQSQYEDPKEQPVQAASHSTLAEEAAAVEKHSTLDPQTTREPELDFIANTIRIEDENKKGRSRIDATSGNASDKANVGVHLEEADRTEQELVDKLSTTQLTEPTPHLEEIRQDESADGETIPVPKSLASVDTVYSADSIEWAPFRGDVFACGTYQIEKLEGTKKTPTRDDDNDDADEAPIDSSSPEIKRHGRVLIYQVTNQESSFAEIQRFDGPAVLDMKWSPNGAPQGHRLAIANAEGQVALHKWNEDKMGLVAQQTVQVEDSSILCLSLDWSHQLEPGHSTSIISSLSNGNLAHLVTDDDGSLQVDHVWHAHDYEPWITSWDLWQPDTIWSGGDDLKLKRWDIRAPMAPTFVNKQFEGGVTTIVSNPHVEHMLAVGSYDSNLRIFDARNPRTALQTIDVGGGIWRTKWHPSPHRKGDVLLACMHGGFNVVRLDDADKWLDGGDSAHTWSKIAHFDKHESIAYGVDWQRGIIDGTEEQDRLVASCSFYDHLMHMWRV